MSNFIPRISSRIGQAEEPPELRGKWFFEIFLTQLGEEIDLKNPIGTFGPFESEEEAKKESANACRLACEEFEKRTCGKVSGGYLDLKEGGKRKSWESKNEK